MRPLLFALAAAAALPGCMASCPGSQDSEAKARIFSAEDPPRAERAAQEAIDPSALSRDPQTRRRVLRMRSGEMYYRLGSFKAETQVSFSWRRAGQDVKLSESAVLEQAPGGDFGLALENDQDFGMELRWVAGKVYAKNLHGQFFERRSDRAAHEQWRDEAVAQLPAVLDLLDGRMVLVETGTGSQAGRGAIKYAVALAEEPDAAAGPEPRPDWARDPVYPERGPDETLLQRLAVQEKGEPLTLTGEVLVDRETGVITRFELRTRFSVPPPAERGGEPALLDLRLSRQITEVGAARTVEVPEHRPFQPRPRAVKSPLAWWPKYVPPAAEDAKAGDTGASQNGNK